MTPLNILHVLRTPVGGLFRHVLDLSRGQIARGHKVGLVMDADSGGPRVDAALKELAPSLALGLSRHSMRRTPGVADIAALMHVMRRIGATHADVVHGHGAKGGAYARLACNAGHAIRAYTPHGGSLHFDRSTIAGRVYLGIERLLMSRSDLIVFESGYSAEVFRRKVGDPSGLSRVVHNGVTAGEFEPVAVTAQATDLLFIGELRQLKGVDVLIEAVGRLHSRGRPVTAAIVGAGTERAEFERQVHRLGLDGAIRFPGAMPARQAFALGRVLVVPSRAESLPYVALEAGAAGKPLIATAVGGIAEILGPDAGRLVPPDDAAALAVAILARLDRPEKTAAAAAALRGRIADGFSVDSMVDGVLAAYAEAMAARGQR
jgi:glycosyltransferase involved in cell wall biosynthesis